MTTITIEGHPTGPTWRTGSDERRRRPGGSVLQSQNGEYVVICDICNVVELLEVGAGPVPDERSGYEVPRGKP